MLDPPEAKTAAGISIGTLRYVQMCDSLLEEASEEPDDINWKPLLALDHKVIKNSSKGRQVVVKINWMLEDPSWVSQASVKMQCPYLLVDYANRRQLHKHKDWK